MNEEALARPNSDDPRDRILCAATTLFAHKGYAGTSTREITKAARVTKPTLYHHFKSKQGLYLTVLGEAMRIFHDRLISRLTRSADIRTCLCSLSSGIESLGRNHPDLVQLINAFFFGPPSEIPCCKLCRSSRFVEAILDDILRRGVEEGEILEDDSQSILLLIMGMLRFIQTTPADSGLLPEEATMNHCVSAIDLILRGSLKRSGVV